MKDLLFKLKMGTKCVGYARFGQIGANGLQLEYSWGADRKSQKLQWYWHHSFPYDSIHPFVCKDRNGENVFEGDKVLDRRDDAVETMDLRFWYHSLCCESEHIELARPEEETK